MDRLFDSRVISPFPCTVMPSPVRLKLIPPPVARRRPPSERERLWFPGVVQLFTAGADWGVTLFPPLLLLVPPPVPPPSLSGRKETAAAPKNHPRNSPKNTCF